MTLRFGSRHDDTELQAHHRHIVFKTELPVFFYIVAHPALIVDCLFHPIHSKNIGMIAQFILIYSQLALSFFCSSNLLSGVSIKTHFSAWLKPADQVPFAQMLTTLLTG